MGERASRPTPEMLLLQQELERTKAALRQEQNMGIQQRRHAQHRIHQEVAWLYLLSIYCNIECFFKCDN